MEPLIKNNKSMKYVKDELTLKEVIILALIPAIIIFSVFNIFLIPFVFIMGKSIKNNCAFTYAFLCMEI